MHDMHGEAENNNPETTKACIAAGLYLYGTSGRTRTATPVKAGDFESPMSTNFITLA